MASKSVSVKLDLNIDPIMAALAGDDFGFFAAGEVYRQFYDAMPYRDGGFANTIDFGTPWHYEHMVPYAKRVYDKNMNFRKDYHPAATCRYLDNYPSALPKVNASLARYVKEKITK